MVGPGDTPFMLPAKAAVTINATNPQGPQNVGSFAMQGLGASPSLARITPKATGNILVTIQGVINSVGLMTAGDGLALKLYYGSGVAPANNGAVTGTILGKQLNFWIPATATVATLWAFSISGVILGAVLSTSLWMDLAAECFLATGSIITNIVVNAVEI